jgi:hypothetical protein
VLACSGRLSTWQAPALPGWLLRGASFKSPNQIIDKDPANVSDLARRLVARIELTDTDDEPSRLAGQPSGRGFWSSDFPRMSVASLLPTAENDQLLKAFSQNAGQIDDAMNRICRN